MATSHVAQVFVLCKTRKTEPSRRHLFLGQALLGGLFLCAAVSGLMCTQPTVLTCATVRLCTGLGYSMVFGTLLVKCVFLISLNGGVYLPAPYQALLLFFAVAIQLAIGVQWLIYSPPQLASPQVSSVPRSQKLDSKSSPVPNPSRLPRETILLGRFQTIISKSNSD